VGGYKLKVKVQVTLQQAMKILAVDGVGSQPHASAVLPREKPDTNCIGEDGWAQEPVWTGEENLASTRIRSPDCPARSKSLLFWRGNNGNEPAPLCYFYTYLNCLVLILQYVVYTG
jgi:hypothetical protein